MCIDRDEENKAELREIHVAGPEAATLAALGAGAANRIFRSPPVPWITLPAFGLSRISSSRAFRASSPSACCSQALVKVAICKKIGYARRRSLWSPSHSFIVTPISYYSVLLEARRNPVGFRFPSCEQVLVGL